MRSAVLQVALDRLVLEGVSPADAARLGPAVERELTRLMEARAGARRPAPARPAPFPASIRVRPGAPVGEVAAIVARALDAAIASGGPVDGPARGGGDGSASGSGRPGGDS